MSHSTAAIKFSDGFIIHGEYNGTSDVMLPQFYLTQEERHANWRTMNWPYHDKTCDKSEDVIVATSYGGGFNWPSKACRTCLLLTDRWMPFIGEEDEYKVTDGLPDWYPDRELYK